MNTPTRVWTLLPAGNVATVHELVEACLAETSPGAFVDLTQHRHRARRGHPVLGAVPGQWWTWVVQLLLPNQGPSFTSFVTVEEALLVLTASMLLHAIGAADARGTQGNARIPVRVPAALLAWTVPAPLTGAPVGDRAASGAEEESVDECSATSGRGGGTGTRGL
jgi:hypothetical protein